MQRKDVQTIVKIRAEGAALHHLLERAMGGGYHPYGVSTKKIKEVHDATHPANGRCRENRGDGDAKEDLLSVLEAEAAQEAEDWDGRKKSPIRRSRTLPGMRFTLTFRSRFIY